LEFLQGLGEEQLATIIKEKSLLEIGIFRDKILDYLKQYFIVGGMPGIVKNYLANQDLMQIKDLQQALLNDYERDFVRHQGKLDDQGTVLTALDVAKMRMIWSAIPGQLARSTDNRRFMYTALKKGARGKSYKSPLYWLEDTGLIQKINRVELPSLPLANYQNKDYFKLFLLDIGLLSAMVGLDITTYNEPDYKIFNHFKGALAEQFAAQEIIANNPHLPICYWANSNSTGEVDFVLQHKNRIVPIEVKSGTNLAAASLKEYIKQYQPELAVITSLSDYATGETVLKIPLFMIGEITKIIA
jgi:predicted AAA+ superfamily ATPase